MSDFVFLKNNILRKWVIQAPKRAKRPDVAKGTEPVCPFCPGREKDEEEVYRMRKYEIQNPKHEISSNNQNPNEKKRSRSENSNLSNVSDFDIRNSNLISHADDWYVRVLKNKYPFAPIHEVIIHSPDHHKNIDEFEHEQVKRILKTYRHRYNEHMRQGQVIIFQNHGTMAGESLPHPHTQLAVVPQHVYIDVQRLEAGYKGLVKNQLYETSDFVLFCPETATWPDEVWIAPQKQGRVFGEITDEEISDLAFILKRLLQIFQVRHNNDFPFNMQIYPGGDFYLRIVPRLKTIGGFELATGIYVNTQDPRETLEFIKTHFENPDNEKISKEHRAGYHKAV